MNPSSSTPVRGLSARIRVILVEDSLAFQAFATRLLDGYPAVHVMERAQDGVQAVRYARELNPDLMLLDIGLPLINGIEVAKRILEFAPNCKIIFLTQESAPEFVEAAFNVGACGYVLKTRTNRDLWPAIVDVFEGKQFLSSGLKQPAAFNPGVLGFATS